VRLFGGLVLAIIGFSLSAQDTLTVDRLDYRFVSYEDGLFSPLVSLESAEVAGVFVACVQPLQLELCGRHPLDVWVDGRLIKRKLAKECIYLKLSALCHTAKRDTVFMTLVSDENLESITARTIRISSGLDALEFNLLKRSTLSEFWYVGFLIGLGLIVSVKYIVPDFWRFRRPNLAQGTYRLSSLDNWILLLLASVVNAFSWAFLSEERSAALFFSTLGFVLLMLIAKFLLVLLAATLFNSWKPTAWQFTFFIRFWFFWSIMAFLAILALHILFSVQYFDRSVFEVFAAGVLGLFVMVVAYFLMTQRGTKSLHIFIYLCTVEILPVGLVIFWFLK